MINGKLTSVLIAGLLSSTVALAADTSSGTGSTGTQGWEDKSTTGRSGSGSSTDPSGTGTTSGSGTGSTGTGTYSGSGTGSTGTGSTLGSGTGGMGYEGKSIKEPSPGRAVTDTPESQAQQSLMQYDRNNDGVIDRQEAAGSPQLSQQFQTLDTDGNGRLSVSELGQFRPSGTTGSSATTGSSGSMGSSGTTGSSNTMGSPGTSRQ